MLRYKKPFNHEGLARWVEDAEAAIPMYFGAVDADFETWNPQIKQSKEDALRIRNSWVMAKNRIIVAKEHKRVLSQLALEKVAT